MQEPEQQHVQATDGQLFSTFCWPVNEPKGRVFIAHGMAEHCLSYRPFAHFLNQHNYEVVAHNHRGHGDRTPLGHFADRDGWQQVIDDLHTVIESYEDDVPSYLFGHSMGSFIALSYAAQQGQQGQHLSGLILSASNYQSSGLFYLGLGVAKFLNVFTNRTATSKLLDQLSFGAFNRAFKPNRTAFDWLSRDHHQVDAYINDPKCGHLCSVKFWQDLFGGLIKLNKATTLAAIPHTLPVQLLAGDQDPVGKMGEGVKRLQTALKENGVLSVEMTLYPNARHEILNEVNAAEVQQDILQWLQQH